MSQLSSPATSYWESALKSLDPALELVITSTVGGRVDVLAGVLRVAQDKRAKCMKKRWRFKNPNGDTIIIRDVMERLIRWIDRFKSVGDVAVGMEQTYASLPWAAVRFLLECASSDVKLFGSVAEILETVARLIVTYREFERLHLNRASSIKAQVEQALVRLYTSILAELGYAVQFFEESTISRIAKSPFRIADEHMVEVRQREEELLKLSGLADTEILQNLEAMTFRLSDRARASDEEVEKKRFQGLLRWLSQTDFRRHHETSSALRLPNTGEWLFDHPEFKSWQISSSSSILLLQGVTGAGKTILASNVVESFTTDRSIHPDSAPFAYFYCSSSTAEADRAQPENIMRCIVRQLTMSSHPHFKVRESLLSEYDRRQAQAQLDGLEDSEYGRLSIPDCLRMILDITRTDPITVIIDAVDEVDEHWRHDLLEALTRIVEHSDNVAKIFVTTRDNDQVLSILSGVPKIRIHPSDNHDDLERFVARQIDNLIQQKRLLGGSVSQELYNRLRQVLLDGAGEMFLWVKLQLEQFCHMKHEQDLLDAIDESRFVTLETLYSEMLDNILNNESGARELAIRVFSWLLYVQEPLTPSAFASAVASQDSHAGDLMTLKDTLRVCFNLVVEDGDSIRFIHQSAQDFIRTLSIFSPSSANRILAERCLRTCIYGPPEISPATQEMTFYRYAAMYWADHSKLSLVSVAEDGLFDLMTHFVFEEEQGDDAVAFSFMAWLDYVQTLLPSLPWDHPKYIELDAVVNRDQSPIFAACIFGLHYLIEQLSARSANIDWNRLNDRGHTGLYLACRKGHTDIAHFLLDRGADMKVLCGTLGNALNAACFSGNLATVELLLSRGRSLWAAQDLSQALNKSFQSRDEDTALTLIDHGMSQVSQDDYNQALLGASQAGLIKVVERLRGSPFHTSKSSSSEQSYNRAIRGGRIPMLQFMMRKLSHSASDLPKDGVATAVLYGQAETVSFLLDLGLSIEEEGQYGSPLRVACLLDHQNLVLALLQRGASINAKGAFGTALEAASMRGCISVTRILLDEGAAVDIGSSSYELPLYAAISNGHVAIAELLISAGASTEWIPQNVLGAANQGAHDDMLVLLKEKGISGYMSPCCSMSFPTYRELLRDHSPERFGGSAPRMPTKSNIVNDPLAVSARSRSEKKRFVKVYNDQGLPSRAEADLRVLDTINRTSPVIQFPEEPWKYQLHSKGPDLFKLFFEAVLNGESGTAKRLLQDERFPSEHLGPAFHHAIGHGLVEIAENITTYALSHGFREWKDMLYISGYLQFFRQGLSLAYEVDSDNLPIGTLDLPFDTKILFAACERFGNELHVKAFFRACELSDKSVVELLLQGAASTLRDLDVLDRALEICAETGNTDLVLLLMDWTPRDLTPEAIDRILTCAAYHGHHDVLRLLMAKTRHLPEAKQVLSRPLIAATIMGHAEAVAFLIQEGADVNAKVEACVESSWTGERNRFCSLNPKITIRDQKRSSTPLEVCLNQLELPTQESEACRYEAVLRILLRSGAEFEQTRSPYADPFVIQAACCCSAAVVQLLIDAGAKLTSLSKEDFVYSRSKKEYETVHRDLKFHEQIRREEDAAPIIECLLQADNTDTILFLKKALSYFDGEDGRFKEARSLQRVFVEGQGAVIYNLLSRLPEEKATDSRYSLVLQMAAFLGMKPYVQLLLERGADVNSVGHYYGTALQAASRCGHAEMATMLLRAGADVNIISGRHKTALRAAIRGAHIETVRMLLSSGATIDIWAKGRADSSVELPNKATSIGKGTDKAASDLYLAIESQSPEIVDAVIGAAAGVDNKCNLEDWVPLVMNYRHGNMAIARILLRGEARDHISDTFNDKYYPCGPTTLLHEACRFGHQDITQLCIDYGADIELCVDGTPRSMMSRRWKHSFPRDEKVGLARPITETAERGRFECVKLLLQAGASIPPDAVVGSCREGRPEILDILLDRIARSDTGIPANLLKECLDELRALRKGDGRLTPSLSRCNDILAEYGASDAELRGSI